MHYVSPTENLRDYTVCKGFFVQDLATLPRVNTDARQNQGLKPVLLPAKNRYTQG